MTLNDRSSNVPLSLAQTPFVPFAVQFDDLLCTSNPQY